MGRRGRHPEEESETQQATVKDRIKATPDHRKWQCPEEEDRAMVARRTKGGQNGT